MARLTKKARRAAALKGLPMRCNFKVAVRRKKASGEYGVFAGSQRADASYGPYRTYGARWMNKHLFAPRKGFFHVMKVDADEPRSNPPSGFIPCKAVQFVKNRGKVVGVRIRK